MTDLPDPHGCPHCGCENLAKRLGETVCLRCLAPRRHAEPGCPVRNVMADRVVKNDDGSTDAYFFSKKPGRFSMVRTDSDGFTILFADRADGISIVQEAPDARMGELAREFAESAAAETARERRVHDGGPRDVR